MHNKFECSDLSFVVEAVLLLLFFFALQGFRIFWNDPAEGVNGLLYINKELNNKSSQYQLRQEFS